MNRLTVLLVLIASVPTLAQERTARGTPPVATPEAQAARIAKLEARVEALAAVLEGTAKPINLARTTLAAVSASSVNGGRSLANGFYGVRNAFDDGDNVRDGLFYSYWLASGEPSPWVEVHFDKPVSLTSLFVEGGPRYVTRLAYAKGGERDFPRVSEKLRFDHVEHGVRSVRLTFQGGGNVRVDEIRVMGHAPTASLRVDTPRLLLDRRHALLAAEEAFTAWRAQQLAAPHEMELEESESTYEVTARQGGVAVLRLKVDRRTGQTTTHGIQARERRFPD